MGRKEWGETRLGRQEGGDKSGEREVCGDTRGGRTGQEWSDKSCETRGNRQEWGGGVIKN